MTNADASLRYQPRRALTALRKLIANPDETEHAFTIIEALAGPQPLRLAKRLRTTPVSRPLIEERADIIPFLSDRAKLEALPEGSFGRAYLAFLDREGISPDGLLEASATGEDGGFSSHPDIRYVSDRLRDTHDLWHTLMGFQGDVKGEVALLAFSALQTQNLGAGLIAFAGMLRWRDPELVRMVAHALRAGTACEWLPGVRFEELLALPLEEVRARLGIRPIFAYTPMRTAQLREAGDLEAAAA